MYLLLIAMSLSDLNDILLVVNQKIQEEEALSPDDTSDRLNRLNKLKDDISAEVEAMNNASSDEEEDDETRAKDEINICTDLKCYKMLLTNGMLPDAFAKVVIEVAKMQESGVNMVLNETTGSTVGDAFVIIECETTVNASFLYYFNRQNTFADLAPSLRENAGINIGEGLKLVGVNNSPTMIYETFSPWGFADMSGGGKNFFSKNEDVMRKLVRRSCDVMSKRYGKKVDVPSAPPLQIAECVNSIKTKQENFKLKLEQENVNFQDLLETLKDNELDKILEVLKSRKGTSEDKIAFVAELVLEDLVGINASIAHLKNSKVELMDFFVMLWHMEQVVVKAPSFPMRNATAP